MFLGKDVLKRYRKFTGDHSWRSSISIKFQSNFIEIPLPHRCSPVNLLHIFRTSFPKKTSGGLLLSKSGQSRHNLVPQLLTKMLARAGPNEDPINEIIK